MISECYTKLQIFFDGKFTVDDCLPELMKLTRSTYGNSTPGLAAVKRGPKSQEMVFSMQGETILLRNAPFKSNFV